MLKERLSHQKGEVTEAKRNLGKLGYSPAYLKRMQDNVKQTERAILYYKKKKR